MSEGRSKRLSSLFSFLRPRRVKDKASDAGSLRTSVRSRSTTPNPPSIHDKSAPPRAAAPTSGPTLAPPGSPPRNGSATVTPASAPSSPPAAALPALAEAAATPASPPPTAAAPATASTAAPAPSAYTAPASPTATGAPIYDASRTSATMSMSRMSGLNEVDVANFPLPPDALPSASSLSPPNSSDPAPAFALDHDLDLTLSNPASPRPSASTSRPASTTQASTRSSFAGSRTGFLRRVSSAGLRMSPPPKSRPHSLLPPTAIPQIDLKFDVGRMDVDFGKQARAQAQTQQAQTQSSTTL